jgi:hypothetical protein
MATASVVDTRNLEWKNNNVGSKLLSAMGWKDGMKVGKRSRVTTTTTSSTTEGSCINNDDDCQLVSSEGLRIIKRQDGLGIGATSFALGEASSRHSHVGDFTSVLESLQQYHTTKMMLTAFVVVAGSVVVHDSGVLVHFVVDHSLSTDFCCCCCGCSTSLSYGTSNTALNALPWMLMMLSMTICTCTSTIQSCHQNCYL